MNKIKELIPKESKEIIYECVICNDNKKLLATQEDFDNGVKTFSDWDYETQSDRYWRKCECVLNKEFKQMLRISGLEHVYDLKLKDYKIKYDWQQNVKDKLIAFTKKPSQMFVINGQSGSGKTMAMNILFKNLIGLRHVQGHYIKWRDFMTSVKNNYQNINNGDYDYITKIPILYIDDLFKHRNNKFENISENEFQIAWQIINSRYNRGLITLISTELNKDELNGVDESFFSRMIEMSTNDYWIDLSSKENRNIRLQIVKGDFDE